MEIYEFDDYRTFLKAAFRRLKRSSRTYSLAKVSKKIGCSQSFIKKLFAKKTHLGQMHASAMLQVLRLSEQEREYIYFWMLYEQSDNSDLRIYLGRVLNELRRRMSLNAPLDDVQGRGASLGGDRAPLDVDE